MWAKIVSKQNRTRFVQISNAAQLYADTLWVPIVGEDGEPDKLETHGIFIDDPDFPSTLLAFSMRAQADLSLRNLFRCWKDNPDELYIVPHGTEWLIEK